MPGWAVPQVGRSGRGSSGRIGTFLKRYGEFGSAKRDDDAKREEIKWLTGREYLMAR
jgi:hypothetical protein